MINLTLHCINKKDRTQTQPTAYSP